MNEIIIRFLQKQKVATICCIDSEGFPYCFNCFFSFDEKKGLLYFKSSPASAHGQYLAGNPAVAGTVLPDKLNPLALQGVQFEGNLLDDMNPLASKAYAHYHLKYPFAIAKAGTMYALAVNHLKMTDNSQGFGTKISWKRETELAAQTT